MFFDSSDLPSIQSFNTDLDSGRLGTPTMDGGRAFSSNAESLHARITSLMPFETVLPEFIRAGTSIDGGTMTTSFTQDDNFIPQRKNIRLSNEGEDGGEVVVVGKRIPGNVIVWDGGGNTGEPTGGDGGLGDGGGGEVPTQPPADEDSIDIQIMIDRPLTDSEKVAIEKLKETIAALEAAIMALADNAVLTLPNGADVTGAELKAIWAKTDFVINDNHVTYSNGGQGEALMAFGQPTISFNVGYLDQYDNLVGGMNYLVAHELGHLSQAGTSFYTDQLTANDIARALLNGAGLPYLANPGYGYTSTAPLQFTVPSSGGTGGGGGPRGGGGGCGGDGSGEQTCW